MLPAAIAEEQARKAKDEAALAQWDTFLPQYPKWTCGGFDYVKREPKQQIGLKDLFKF